MSKTTSDTCDHCDHLYYNCDGSVACDSPFERVCLNGQIRLYKEPKNRGEPKTGDVASCKDCQYCVRHRLGEHYFDGHCKCTGVDLDFRNFAEMTPEWCPYNIVINSSHDH